MIDSYDVLRLSTTSEDGIINKTWTAIETRKMEVQPVRWYRAEQLEVELGGKKYTPTFVGWAEYELLATAGDRITANSGATDYLVLRVHEYEDHREMDLREVPER